MQQSISAKELRLHMREITNQVMSGKSFTLIYNSNPVAEIIPYSNKRMSNIEWEEKLNRLRDSLEVNKGKKFNAVKLVHKIRAE